MQVRTTITLAQIPKFDPIAQLCAASNNAIWVPATGIKPKRKQPVKMLEARQLILDSMGDKQWLVNELRDFVNEKHKLKLKRDTVRAHLNELVARKYVKKAMGSAHVFWRA